MRFECNCETDGTFAEMVDEMHKAETGVNFEIGARLWYTPEGFGKTIMVEYNITTQDCRDLVENQDEPDWLTAYEVDNEQDCDCSNEIFTETTDNYISISALKEAMINFAKEVYQRFYSKENDNLKTIDKNMAGSLGISLANKIVNKLKEGKSVDNVLNDAQNRSSVREIQSYKEKYPYLAQCADFDKVINSRLSKSTLELIEQSIAAYELNDDIYYDENLGELIIPDDIVVDMNTLSWYAGQIDTKQFLEHVKEYDLDQDVTKDDFDLGM